MQTREEIRAQLLKMREQSRGLSPEQVRKMSAEAQSAAALAMQSWAACYALIDYVLYYFPSDSFPDGLYRALSECCRCCAICCDFMENESALSPACAELCSAACRQVAMAAEGVSDPLVQACVGICNACAIACDAIEEPGEAEEGRSRKPSGRDERRSFRFEARAESDGHVRGYPIVFGSLSADLGGFCERISPDAVTLDDDLKVDFDHDSSKILGSVQAGTAAVSIDSRGVFMDVTPPDTQWYRDLKQSMDRGDITQGSFTFRILPGGQTISQENGQQIRTLTKILVRRLSIVSDPAYPDTSVEARSAKNETTGQQGSEPVGLAAQPAIDVDVAKHRRRRQLQLASL